MSKASQFANDLVSRQLSPKEIQERQDAAKPRTKLVATSTGKLVEPAPTPTQTPREYRQAPQQTTD
jgi:hypothetical protein